MDTFSGMLFIVYSIFFHRLTSLKITKFLSFLQIHNYLFLYFRLYFLYFFLILSILVDRYISIAFSLTSSSVSPYENRSRYSSPVKEYPIPVTVPFVLETEYIYIILRPRNLIFFNNLAFIILLLYLFYVYNF